MVPIPFSERSIFFFKPRVFRTFFMLEKCFFQIYFVLTWTSVQVVSGAGHHVYADKPEAFNQIVLDACNYSDGVVRNNLALMPPDSGDESDAESDATEPSNRRG